MKNIIYLDNAATTQVNDDALLAIQKYNKELFFNPSALYKQSVEVFKDIEIARSNIAKILNTKPEELFFISSGTEGDNAALLFSKKKKGSRIIISDSEHSAIYKTAMYLKNQGHDVKLAPVDRYGRVIEEEFVKLIDENTSTVSIMHVNNETGAINDVVKLSRLAKSIKKDLVFHSDGVQAFTKVPIDLKNSEIDLYTVSGHKITAPKGIACLYVSSKTHLNTILYGGGQEKGLRSSTENTSGIIAMDISSQSSILKYGTFYNNSSKLLQKVADFITQEVPKAIICTNFEKSAPHILSIAFPNIRGEILMHSVEKYGIIIGIGSACSSASKTKRIPTALNLPTEYHNGMIRISIQPDETWENLEYSAKMIIKEYNFLKQFIRG